MMTGRWMLFVNGYDVPGLGAALTKTLFDLNCSILNIKMITMEGFFSVIILLEAKRSQKQANLINALILALSPFNAEVSLKPHEIPKESADQQLDEWIPYQITLLSEDKVGVLYFFMKEMSRLKINIMDVRCRRIETNHATPDYQIIARIEVPIRISPNKLKKSLDALSHELNIQLDLAPVEDLEL